MNNAQGEGPPHVRVPLWAMHTTDVPSGALMLYGLLVREAARAESPERVLEDGLSLSNSRLALALNSAETSVRNWLRALHEAKLVTLVYPSMTNLRLRRIRVVNAGDVKMWGDRAPEQVHAAIAERINQTGRKAGEEE